MSDTLLINLPIPNVKNEKITIPKKEKKEKKEVNHLDEVLTKEFLENYFSQKKSDYSIDER